MINLCAPAIIYIVFSMIQIVIDTFKGLYNTAFMKSIVMIFVTFLLNLLCEGGLTIVSWIIVFIPFILMTVIVTMLLYIFGLNATTGQANYSCKKYPDNITIDENNNIIIYDPAYNYLKILLTIKNQIFSFQIRMLPPILVGWLCKILCMILLLILVIHLIRVDEDLNKKRI